MLNIFLWVTAVYYYIIVVVVIVIVIVVVIVVVIILLLLTLSAHAPEGYSSHLVCRFVNIGSQRSLGFKL